MKKIALLLITLLSIIACKDEKKETPTIEQKEVKKETPQSAEKRFAKNIENAHQISNFSKQKAVQFQLDLMFGGKNRMNAKITMLTNSSKIKIEKEDGTTLIYNEGKVSLSPKENNYDKARFDILTWTYFFALPFKLTDPGTNWQNLAEKDLKGTTYDTAKLTFKDNTGDAPDDWYVIYADQRTKLMKAAAYIVTLGKDTAAAEENPHAIVYDNYFSVSEVAFAKKWTFYNWSEAQGIYGEAIGKGEISRVKFLEPNEGFFEAPTNSIEVKK